MGIEKTYIMLKPDCVKRGHYGGGHFKNREKGLQDC